MVASTSVGAIVPTVKSEPETLSDITPPEEEEAAGENEETPPRPSKDEATAEEEKEQEDEAAEERDKDLLCPICMQIIKDAFLTSCGHSFCYMCIVTHLHNKSDCPSCAHFLTTNQLYPNFLLNQVGFFSTFSYSLFAFSFCYYSSFLRSRMRLYLH